MNVAHDERVIRGAVPARCGDFRRRIEDWTLP